MGGKRVTTEQAWDHRLIRRARTGDARFRLRAMLRIYGDEIDNRAHKTPMAWSVSMMQFSKILRYMASDRTREAFQCTLDFYGMSPRRLIERMHQCLDLARAGVEAYRARGIDPQVEVTVNPYIAMAKEALELWRDCPWSKLYVAGPGQSAGPHVDAPGVLNDAVGPPPPGDHLSGQAG